MLVENIAEFLENKKQLISTELNLANCYVATSKDYQYLYAIYLNEFILDETYGPGVNAKYYVLDDACRGIVENSYRTKLHLAGFFYDKDFDFYNIDDDDLALLAIADL